MIRNYEPLDLERVRKLHGACGLDYAFPDLDAPSMVVKRVMEGDGEVRAFAMLKLTAEAFLLMDGGWRSPAWRWEALKHLHEDVRQKASCLLLDDVFCAMPPKLEKMFGSRLKALGWERERSWPIYSTRVE